MPTRLNAGAPGFDVAFAALLTQNRAEEADVSQTVAAIITDVAARGDAALIDYTQRFDRVSLTAQSLRLGADAIAAARANIAPDLLAALEEAAGRIEAFHRRQMPRDMRFTDEAGVELGLRHTPIDAVGLYVPGGTAAYPSSVLMNALPARVAGVPRRVMVTPTPDGAINPAVLVAAELAGITEIYRIGGAQAVAALAYGTATIAPVDKIVGPGNAYVAAAKRQLFGVVGIDTIAGPSEILVLADSKNNPDWIAADLLSQAEHDTAARSILITDDAAFSARVEQALEAQLATLARADIARQSWRERGVIITLDRLEDAPALINRLAPEHLELATSDPERLLPAIRHAGAIFLGRYTPEAIGDYIAGPNHVLPTARSARFSSGLSTSDFVKRSSLIKCTPASLAALGGTAVTLAEAEGLEAHARSVTIRTNN